MSARAAALPPTLRVAATARRVLGSRGTRAVYGSPVAARLRRLLASSAPERPQLVEVCGGALRGLQMYVDLNCEKYYWLGTHEEPVQRALLSYVRPGGVAWDIGAHVGFFSLLLSRAAGETGRVLAFEPHAANVARLTDNVVANAIKNIDVRAFALSDRAGHERFSLHASSLEGSLDADVSLKAVTVPATTIDDAVREGAPPPELMKIDVEGAEGRVLRGGRATIPEHRPVMLIEIHSTQAWSEVRDALAPSPYVFSRIGDSSAPAKSLPGHYLAVPADAR